MRSHQSMISANQNQTQPIKIDFGSVDGQNGPKSLILTKTVTFRGHFGDTVQPEIGQITINPSEASVSISNHKTAHNGPLAAEIGQKVSF